VAGADPVRVVSTLPDSGTMMRFPFSGSSVTPAEAPEPGAAARAAPAGAIAPDARIPPTGSLFRPRRGSRRRLAARVAEDADEQLDLADQLTGEEGDPPRR
jgi:hypothetical protein